MRKAFVLYNPLSGRRRERRLADVETVLAVLRGAGIEALALETHAGTQAGEQAAKAVAQGWDTVLACGGDGTVHDVLQGMVGSPAALGIIPLGTANALAHDLRLPLSVKDAARAAVTAEPRRIAVGQIHYRDLSGKASSRYFTVVAGIGVDAHLFYQLNPQVKSRLGTAAYYAKATGLWLAHRMANFCAEFGTPGATEPQRVECSQLLAVRISNFGGVLRQLAPGASLTRNQLRLVLFQTRSRTAYLRYVLRGMLGTAWSVAGVGLAYSEKVISVPLPGVTEAPKIFVEADGELLGTLPAEITIVPDALTLLMPEAYGSAGGGSTP
jgi:YegS/Rv2252/BmrU family lipid kinase